MNEVTAVVYENIPANRTLELKGAGNDPELDSDKIYIKLASKGTDPDMVSTKELQEGEEVTVTIKGSPVWKAELSADTRPGTLVSCDGEGLIRWTSTRDHSRYIGYSLEGGQAGDVIHFARKNGPVDVIAGTGMEGKMSHGEEV